MIWRIVTQYAALAGGELQLTSPLAYALFDGLFQRALAKQLANDAPATRELSMARRAPLPRSVRRANACRVDA